MKKILSAILALTLVAGLTACGGQKAAPTTEATTLPAAVDVPESAVSILETIWGDYTSDEKFPAMGGMGDSSVMDAPAALDMTSTDPLTYNLLVPADVQSNVDDAATLMHMMNANTFTSGALHLKDGANPTEFANAMQKAISGNQWICGFPDILAISVVGGEYVVVAFGAQDLVDSFQNHLEAMYPTAEVLFNEPVM